MALPGKGTRLAIDVGSVRIGIARCSTEQIMAVPECTVLASQDPIKEIARLVDEYKIELVYVGNPISLAQKVTPSTELAKNFALELAKVLEVDVHMLDERLTTVSAQTQLRDSGKSSKDGRSVIDQVAAVLLLDHALAMEKSTSRLAGIPINPSIK